MLNRCVAALLAGVLVFTAPAVSGQRPSPPRDREPRVIHRDNERVSVEGLVRTIHRERDGYRVELDRNDGSFWVPERAVRDHSRDFRIGVSVRFGGLFRGGVVLVDVVEWMPVAPNRDRRHHLGVLRGFVERVYFRTRLLRVREENSGRLIEVTVRRAAVIDDVRRGDFITFSGEWKDRDEFEAMRVEAIRPRR